MNFHSFYSSSWQDLSFITVVEAFGAMPTFYVPFAVDESSWLDAVLVVDQQQMLLDTSFEDSFVLKGLQRSFAVVAFKVEQVMPQTMLILH